MRSFKSYSKEIPYGFFLRKKGEKQVETELSYGFLITEPHPISTALLNIL